MAIKEAKDSLWQFGSVTFQLSMIIELYSINQPYRTFEWEEVLVMPPQSSYEITEAIGLFSKIDSFPLNPWNRIFWSFGSVTPI